MKTPVSNSILTIAALTLAVSFSTSAAAERVSESTMPGATAAVQTISIAYSQADISTQQGRDNLHRKIRHAAKNVCGPTGLGEAGGLSMMSRNRKCYDEAVNAALSQVGAGQQTAMSSD